MDNDQRAIQLFLKSYPGQFVSPRIISRRAGTKRQYSDNPLWALPVLGCLLEKDIVERDAQGHYRLKPRKETKSARVWVSPQIKQLLQRSGSAEAQLYDLDEVLEEDI